MWTLFASAGCIGLGQMLIMIGQQTFVANASGNRASDSAFGTLTAAASIGQPLVTSLASMSAAAGCNEPNTSVGLAVCAAMLLLGLPAYVALRRTDRGRSRNRGIEDSPSLRTTDLLKAP